METMAWPLEPEEAMWVFRSIQFTSFKWDIFHRGDTSILTDALILTAEQHNKAVEIAEGVWAALRKVEHQACQNRGFLKDLAVPEGLHDAILEQRVENPRVTRCDLHLTEGGEWMISEFNDDVPSGFGECTGLNEALETHFKDRFAGLEFRGDLRKALVDSFGTDQSIGLVHASGYSEDLQHVALVAEWLKQEGKETTIGSPSNLEVREGKAYLFEEPIDALFRYFPGEWLSDLPNSEAWKESAAFLPSMNPLSALASQSKRFYALFNEREIHLKEEERELLHAHIPYSLFLSSVKKEEVLQQPEKWVLKGSFGRMGNTVRIGPLMPKEKWEKAVEEAYEVSYVVAAQRRFDTRSVWTTRGMGYPTLGVYLVDGKFAGYFSRIDKGPLIHYDSWHVPTLVKTT